MIQVSFKVALLFALLILVSASEAALAANKNNSARENAKQESANKNSNQEDPQLQKAVVELEKLATKQVTSKTVPGLAIAVVKNGKVIYLKGFGVRQVDKSEAVDEDTVFQLASVSKSIASSMVASLVSDGKVTWDSRICELDPEFQMSDPWVTRELTIRDLLCHRSGLPEHAGDLLEDIGYDRQQVLYRLRYQEPDSSFRSKYNYTNFGFTEGALAAAKITGMTWENLCDLKLFKPLKMISSSARFSDFMARPDKAAGHIMVDGKWVHREQRDPDAQSPAGGISSSAKDLANWMIMEIDDGVFEGKQIINKGALEETHHPQMLTQFNPANGLPGFYGLGFNVSYDEHGRLHLGHSGAFCMGAATTVEMVPSEKLGVCILTNAAPIGVAEGLARTFMDTAMEGKPSRDWMALFKKIFADPATVGVVEGYDYSKPPTTPGSSLPPAVYTGRYSNRFFGDVEVIEQGAALAVKIGPKEKSFPLTHYDRDIFTYDMESENMTGRSGLRFGIGPDGKPSNVLIENLNIRGQGLFTRTDHTKSKI